MLFLFFNNINDKYTEFCDKYARINNKNTLPGNCITFNKYHYF